MLSKIKHIYIDRILLPTYQTQPSKPIKYSEFIRSKTKTFPYIHMAYSMIFCLGVTHTHTHTPYIIVISCSFPLLSLIYWIGQMNYIREWKIECMEQRDNRMIAKKKTKLRWRNNEKQKIILINWKGEKTKYKMSVHWCGWCCCYFSRYSSESFVVVVMNRYVVFYYLKELATLHPLLFSTGKWDREWASERWWMIVCSAWHECMCVL